MSKTLRWTLIALAAVFVLYTIAWFGVARVIDKRVAKGLDEIRLSGLRPVCTERTMVGFPLAMTMTCATTGVRPVDAQPVQAGRLAISAPFTSPGLFTGTLAAPLLIGEGDRKVSARWSEAMVRVNTTLRGVLQTMALDLADLTVTAGPHEATIEAAAILLQPDATNAADLLASLTTDAAKASLPYGRTLAATDLVLRLHLEDGARDLLVRRMPLAEVLADGAKLRLDLLRADVAGGALVATGPLTVSPEGLVSGTIRLGLENPDALARWAASLNPDAEQMVQTMTQAVTTMGAERPLDGETMPAVDLAIDKGELRLGFIRLGQIPPLDLR